MTTTAPTAPTADEVVLRTIAGLERAQNELQAIDLRSLRASRAAVREARDAMAEALRAVKAGR